MKDKLEFSFYDDKLLPFYRSNTAQSIHRKEKLPSFIYLSSAKASEYVAGEIAALVKAKQDKNEHCILGLATGSTPKKVYEELIRYHKEDGLSFRNVITFNLDEYYPMQPDSFHSYHLFMYEHLFSHLDIQPENIYIPDGTIEKKNIGKFCRDYEQKIRSCGGIDLQLLGIGRTGHMGFNEPGSPIDSRTRLITLDHITRQDAASDFFGVENVPLNAITMGVGTILDAKRIILMAFGEAKSSVIQQAVEGPVTEEVPATYLQHHKNVSVILDAAAAADLTRIKTPWLVGEHDWPDRLVRKGVVWLCQKVNKPILKLTDRDYNDNGMSDLLTEMGTAYRINIRVFNELQHTISGWPGGKPGADDSTRPERSKPYPKKVLVFSPHPDDDVICMGGTLSRLVEQRHEVHTAYQTSGSIAVHDDDVIRYLDFVNDYNDIFGLDKSEIKRNYKEIMRFVTTKKPGQVDSATIQKLKAAIRRGEARAACRYTRIPLNHVHFLDMPFYETGKVKKKPLSRDDIQIVENLLQKIKPHQIYAAGDLSDPHGTHRTCLNAIFLALAKLKDETWFKDTYIWLYRGAWQEWDLDQVDMAVPLSPDELLRKRLAIFKHQSQKDRPLFPGIDTREFWQRADDRNKATAHLYDRLGMAEYEAIEAFVRYK